MDRRGGNGRIGRVDQQRQFDVQHAARADGFGADRPLVGLDDLISDRQA